MDEGWPSQAKPPPTKRKRNIEELTRSYVDLLAEAIASSPTKTMTVGEICAYLKERYGSGKSETTLKNTVRHTLSCYGIFKKVRKEEYSRPALWTVCKEEFLDIYRSENEPGPSGLVTPSNSERTQQEAETQTIGSFEKLPTLSKLRSMFPLTKSASFPNLLSDEPELEGFTEPYAARYSVPADLDQMR